MLIRGLPLESRTAREIGAPKPGEWDTKDELLRLAVNDLRGLQHLFVKANSKKGTHVPAPQLIPRPNVRGEHTRRRQSSAEDLARALRAGKGSVRYRPKD